MVIKLKPLNEQVIFITGATNSIGPATIHRAVEQGAKVFMVSRNESELQHIQNEMSLKGYETAFFVADAADEDRLQLAAAKCMVTFGRIDTFINNSNVDIAGEEAKGLFDANFWSLVNGCKVALPLMQDEGGVIINIGGAANNLELSVQGIYAASEQAIKGYMDAFRKDLISKRIPIQVSLVLPSSIETAYDADVISQAILKCAVKPRRELRLGRIVPTLKRITAGKWSAFAGGLGFLLIMKLRKLRSF